QGSQVLPGGQGGMLDGRAQRLAECGMHLGGQRLQQLGYAREEVVYRGWRNASAFRHGVDAEFGCAALGEQLAGRGMDGVDARPAAGTKAANGEGTGHGNSVRGTRYGPAPAAPVGGIVGRRRAMRATHFASPGGQTVCRYQLFSRSEMECSNSSSSLSLHATNTSM